MTVLDLVREKTGAAWRGDDDGVTRPGYARLASSLSRLGAIRLPATTETNSSAKDFSFVTG